MRPTRKWWRIAEIYKRFATESGLDFSDDAAVEMYRFESAGKGDLRNGLFGGKLNGYAIGKHWMDVTIKMWREDIASGLLFRHELEEYYPAWFLDIALK